MWFTTVVIMSLEILYILLTVNKDAGGTWGSPVLVSVVDNDVRGSLPMRGLECHWFYPVDLVGCCYYYWREEEVHGFLHSL